MKKLTMLLLAVSAAGCGGGMKYRVDDAAMDAIPASDQQPVLDARRDLEVSQGDRRTVADQLEETNRELDIADKERQQAQLRVDQVTSNQDAAVKSLDENRANTAEHNKEVAGLDMKVAEAKIEWLTQKRTADKQAGAAADAHIEANNAKVELEKARVAKAKGIKTASPLDVSDFESQWKGKNSDFESAEKDAASEEKSAKKLEEKWQDLQAQRDKMK
ncbi:MAG TPA: hypothetical protein VH374_20360 [Polyangia bacterium]|nr:hypothetical protein [Polyangia bacterium]